MQRHGISRQIQPAASGSTPHDRVAVLQIHSSCSLALDRPRQSAPRSPPPAPNRPTICRVRHYQPRIPQPLHRRTTRRIGSIQISQLARSSQITIAPAAPPYVPYARFPPLEAFGRRPPEHAALSRLRPASETLYISGHARWDGQPKRPGAISPPIWWSRPRHGRGDARRAPVACQS